MNHINSKIWGFPPIQQNLVCFGWPACAWATTQGIHFRLIVFCLSGRGHAKKCLLLEFFQCCTMLVNNLRSWPFFTKNLTQTHDIYWNVHCTLCNICEVTICLLADITVGTAVLVFLSHIFHLFIYLFICVIAVESCYFIYTHCFKAYCICVLCILAPKAEDLRWGWIEALSNEKTKGDLECLFFLWKFFLIIKCSLQPMLSECTAMQKCI